jgi:hypothetical protein
MPVLTLAKPSGEKRWQPGKNSSFLRFARPVWEKNVFKGIEGFGRRPTRGLEMLGERKKRTLSPPLGK